MDLKTVVVVVVVVVLKTDTKLYGSRIVKSDV